MLKYLSDPIKWWKFTDEEMDDPQVLCVKTPSPRSGDMLEWKVYPEQKTLWFKRMTDPEWWSKDWSDGTLCWNGEFGPGVKIFVQNHPYLQGISVLVPKESKEFYQPGKSEFAFAVGDLEAAELVIRRIIIATK
jgi:hypothetical protein